MFAIALWDERAGRLILARDRLGKKPLVYAQHGTTVYFASEAKAILALPEIPRTMDAQALHSYLLFQYVPAPASIYAGFHKLPPGHSLEISAQDEALPAPRSYWRVPQPHVPATRAAAPTDEEPYLQRLDRLLRAAVERRLIADVPLGAFLSGGIDSSIVVSLMHELGVSPLRTFSIGFPDARYDETRYARLVANRLGTEHHEHIVTPQASEILDTLAWHFDEPFGDSSAIPTYYVSRHTRAAVTVALTGDGGDECFGGYDRYRAAALAERLEALPAGLRRGMGRAARLIPHGRARTVGHRLYRFVSGLGVSPARRYLSWMFVFRPEQLQQLYRPDFLEQIDFEAPLAEFERVFHSAPGSAAQRANYLDFQTYLPGDVLAKVDLASMACSLECRCPFLDHELVEFAATLPPRLRFGRGEGKALLRRWARDRLPPEVLNRPKMGFGVPIGQWFRTELRGLLRDCVLAPDSLPSAILRRAPLQRLVDAHLSGRESHDHALWSLLMLELWRRRWQPQGWR
jgi:asparagine synthase (glutamine-hydrolysing)